MAPRRSSAPGLLALFLFALAVPYPGESQVDVYRPPSAARANLALGTASGLDAGTAANNVVQRDGSGNFPAVVSPSLTVPAGSTAITQVKVYSASLTPAATSAAIGTAEQTFTVTGLTTADKVFVNGPAPTALCPPVTYRVSAVDTLAIGFADLTAGVCTPTAGTYLVVAIRS